MPWMECSVMDERVRFVGRLLDGESMSDERTFIACFQSQTILEAT